MKRSLMILPIVAMALALSGCTAMFNSSSYGTNDLYRTNNRAEVAAQLKAEAEAERLEAEARRAQWEARTAQAYAAAAEAEYYATINDEPSYTNIVADDYQSAYARRLYGFQSPTYKMPSSYYDLVSSSSIYYVTAFDPAYYNVMVSGDQVWVEPKYITSMFGSWGATNVTFGLYASPWTYGWSYHVDPFYYSTWGYPHYSWYDWNWSICYGPSWGFGFSWGWGGYYRPWRPYHYHWGHHHYYGPHWGHHHFDGGPFWGGYGGHMNRGGSMYGSRGDGSRTTGGTNYRGHSMVNRGSSHTTPYRSPNSGEVYNSRAGKVSSAIEQNKNSAGRGQVRPSRNLDTSNRNSNTINRNNNNTTRNSNYNSNNNTNRGSSFSSGSSFGGGSSSRGGGGYSSGGGARSSGSRGR